jgi:hypothetical protein
MPVPSGFAANSRKQSKFARGRSPLYEALFLAFGDWWESGSHGWFRDLLNEQWKDREFGAWFEPPLVIAASLHASVLRGDPDTAALGPYYSRRDGAELSDGERAAFLGAVEQTLRSPNPQILGTLRGGLIQTNEIRRSVCWLLGSVWLGLTDFDLVELGSSAGLSLVADQLGWIVKYPDSAPCSFGGPDTGLFSTEITEGQAPFPGPRRIGRRFGVDRNPLDPHDGTNRLWLRALVWPDQKGRLELLDRVLDTATRPGAPEIEFMKTDLPGGFDAEFWARKERPVLFWNSITTGYFSDTAYAELKTRIGQVLDRRPGAWLEFELFREGVRRPETVRKEESPLTARWRASGQWEERLLAAAEAHVPSIRWFAGRAR